ncbi:MAG: gamma-glutamyltranspeptidase/glutathione hydrolase [Verrucomicrobiales bacterium]|jgi:gamma-glutamyltranspeptidase/glutathione hydrolase
MKTALVPLFLLPALCIGQAPDVLPDEFAPDVPKTEMMSAWLKKQAFEALDRRDAAFEQLLDEDLETWQAERREFFLKQLGGFPERTPLNPQITGKREFDDYRIEKLYFESQPGFHVTCTLYLPLGDGPFPAVLHPTGHSASAKNRELYQQASITIARGGCAVICYDPVGQGERRQLLKPDGSKYATTEEHMLINQGAFLLGSNTARYMIWDGMRVIDYLQSRPDIMPDKIGCTGISGGGTNTSYLMALDDRIVAAAPGCYLTGYRSLLSTLGPQDAEQNIHGQIAFGMDHADYVLMRSPQPTLIMAATRDYFDIKGAWNLHRAGKRFYTRQGFPERVDLVEPDTEHGFPMEMRVAASNWMRRWLLDNDEPIGPEPEFDSILPEEELNATPTGHVLDLEGARTAFDLNADWAASFADQRAENAKPENRQQLLAKVRELTGAPDLADLSAPKVGRAGKSIELGPNVAADAVVIEIEEGISLPGWLCGPENLAGEPGYAIYFDGNGKGGLQPGGPVAELAKNHIVLVVDLRGLGETRKEGSGRGFDELVGSDWKDITLASLLGKSYVGMRAGDISQCARALRNFFGIEDLKPDLIAIGEAGIPALHAAALEPDLFGKVRISESVRSWQDIVDTPYSKQQWSNLVFGALREYDLTHLEAAIGPDKLTIERPTGPDGSIQPPEVSHRAVGSKSAVATAHPLATQAAIKALNSGGNAVDAAVTAGLTLGVVDGHNSGIGGGCFMIIRDPDGAIHVLDGREMAPAAATRDMFITAEGIADTEGSKVGPLASGIPGSLAVYEYVLEKFGTRSLAACLESGIVIAERGFPIDSAWARKVKSNSKHFEHFGYPAEVLMPFGIPMKASETLRQPDLAATYRAIANGGADWFYRGEFAEKTAAWMLKNNGIITAADFANYEIKIRKPVRSNYRGYEIIGMPPPSSGGVHVAQILNILENFKMAELDETDRTHVLIEAMKLAFADRAHWLGDADFADVPRGLASPDYAAELAKRIDLAKAAEVEGHATPPNAESDLFEKHTTHFTVADSEGWWVACTATVNTSFGSKVMIPGTGVIMNNQMDDFSAQPGVPNAFGLIGTEANAIEPGKRPLSSMSPTIVLKDGEPVLTVGAAGGPTIITQVVQAIHRYADLNLPLEECLGLPRVHQQWSPTEVRIEAGFDEQLLATLKERGHQLKETGTGTSQAIRRNADESFEAAADPRREGRADATD